MGNKVTLNLDTRVVQGKKVARLRLEGVTPAVIYGNGFEPMNVQAPHNIIEKVFRDAGTHTPVHLTIGSKKKIAMIKDVDKEPTKGTIRHISFHAVKQNEPVTTDVPIHLTGQGESEAEKAGLIVLQSLEKIEVKALPMDLPEALEISVDALHAAGDRLTVADIQLPKNVELVDNSTGRSDDAEEHSITELVVATVYEPSSLAAANESAGGDSEEDMDSVESENGADTPQGTQAAESRPGGKGQDEPKQSELDANKV